MPAQQSSSLLYGAKEPALWRKTIGDLIKEQSLGSGGQKPAIIVPWQNFRSTYGELAARSRLVALSLLHYGMRHGDRIGVMAGNRYEYIDIFVGAARIGCPVVLLNNTYSPSELLNACKGSSCKMVFMATNIGQVNLGKHMDILSTLREETSKRGFRLVCLDRSSEHLSHPSRSYYDEFIGAASYSDSQTSLEEAERKVKPEDLINLQFTSGTTGAPKAAMLTSLNLINNARFVADGIRIRDGDVLCCPPPLFHCFGLVLGVFTAFTHGIPVLLPSDTFDPVRTMKAIHAEKATILHGVPTMFLAELQVVAKTGRRPTTLRTCFGAGSAVTMALVKQLNEEMGVKDVLIGYGMTETSPISFMTVPEDSLDKKLSTIGRLIPHVGAKVIDQNGNILPRGQKGELCTTGFGLQQGYLDNPVKTDEVMKKDSDGVLWMHTGDEVFIDEDGYGHITGRIKDMIIRGGENIYPGEIEERLLEHPAISEASVVGMQDSKYGEVVGAFLRLAGTQTMKPSYDEMRQWVQDKMARQKAPRYVFWVGEGTEFDLVDYPKTGSGKYQKAKLRDIGNKLLMAQKTMPRAKL